jgi:hypothetical protein
MQERDEDLDQEGLDFPETGLSRRALLRTAGAASLVLPAVMPEAAEAAAGKRGRFFSAADFALCEELSETIIPTDAHSPGAKAAGVAQEIDRRLAEQPAFDPDAAPRKRLWREGLKLFAKLSPAERVGLLTDLAKNERKPVTAGELFFVELKKETARAYYTSQIGLQQELEYKGNSYLQEFVGHDVATVPIRKK